MLGVASTTSSSSSLSVSSASESTQAPRSNLHTEISSTMVVAGSELPSILEMMELEIT
jgi:hypothetical protein